MRIKYWFVFSAWMALAGFVNGQSSVNGYVYEDANGNGKKDRREKGLADVAVSNGREVTLSDKNGKYTLPVGEDNAIFVIKPTGYKTPVNEDNLPQYFYMHKPKGSPQYKFQGVDPTGALPRSVDFGLSRSDEGDDFKVMIFGDPQAYNLKEIAHFDRGIVAEAAGVPGISFGISLGDLVGDNPDLFIPYINAAKKMGVPWYNVMGNHDRNHDAEADSLADESFERHFGPANYSFNYGKAHFIILDDILAPDPRQKPGYWGGFTAAQLDFIKNDLQNVPKDYLVVLGFHIPLSEIDDRDLFRDEDREELFQLLKDFPYTLSMSAHTHMQRQDFMTQEHGWTQEKPHHHYNVGTTSGDWYSGLLDDQGIPYATMRDGTPKGYAIMSVSGNQYVIDYKVAGKPADYRMEISAPKLVRKMRNTSAGIYVNFFMGSENDDVKMRIDGGKWQKMNYVRTPDPAYLHLLHEWDYADELPAGRRPRDAEDCRHLWRASIPSNLSLGTHTIEVRVVDMFGRTFTDESSYQIVE